MQMKNVEHKWTVQDIPPQEDRSLGPPQIFASRCLKSFLSPWNKCADKVSSHMQGEMEEFR
jgi:hypothetical protein